MIRRLLLMVLMALPFLSRAQYLEGGVMLGASNYNGDLAHQPVVLEESNFAAGILARYHFSPYFALRGNLYYLPVSANDGNSVNEERNYRNLSFRSSIFEFAIAPEIYFMGIDYEKQKFFSPYVYAGVAAARFNPTATLGDKKIELKDLNTEAQDETYKLTTLAVPVGAGIKYAFNKNFNLGLEGGYRFTGTDYIDDVSGLYPNWFELGSDEARSLVDRYWEIDNRLGNPNFDNGIGQGDLNNTVGLYRNGIQGIGEKKEGRARGDNSKSDSYYYLGVTLTYNFRKDESCPTFW